MQGLIMAGYRDDSAGSYGQWINPQDQSWLDYLKMKGSDVGGGAYNALANITGALSPVGTSPEGNMSFQVPPMVTGLVDSAKRIGQRGGFTRVPELDEQLKQDLSNVVLSLYGGNALAGLTKPRGALGAGAMREAGESKILGPGEYIPSSALEGIKSASTRTPVHKDYILPDGPIDDFDRDFARRTNTIAVEYPDNIQTPFENPYDRALSEQAWRDKIKKTGELYSDTGKPNILGSALATAGELPMDHASRMARAKEMGFDTDNVLYHGTRAPEFDAFKPSDSGMMGSGVYVTPEQSIAESYGKPDYGGRVMPLYARGNIAPYDVVHDLTKKYWDESGGGYAAAQKKALDEVRRLGYDGVHSSTGSQSVVFDPKNLRSVNAAFDPARAGENGLLLSDNKPSIFGASLATAGEQPKGIVAYHGSPHDFDKFSLDKIGTGEGAQAYGHGLYFADSEGVARSYRDKLSGPPVDNVKLEIRARNQEAMGDVDGAARLRAMKKEYDPNGKMYQVRINADPESFLDWDKPLSQQSEKVRSAWDAIARSPDAENAAKDFYSYSPGNTLADLPEFADPYGSTIYRQTPGSVEAASAKLREAGIPGIRYLDGNSRGSGSGSSNYVVFDDSLIEILKKYGIAAGAVGAGALAQPDQASAQDVHDWLKF